MAFSQALDQLTQAMYRSADALDSSRSGASSIPSWQRGLPMPVRHLPEGIPITDEATFVLNEADLAYTAPFANYAGLTTQMPEKAVSSSSPSGPQTGGSGYDKEISQLTKQFALSGRSDASSESRKSVQMNWQSGFANMRSEKGILPSDTSQKRPDAGEIQDMAASVGERCGADQESAMAMLGVMTDVLFGADPRAQSRSILPANMQRPSPRTLDDISDRVIQRTGTDKADDMRQLILKVTNSMFGPAAGEEPPTARSSVRSRSTTSAATRQEVNLEVRDLCMELCGEIFNAQ